MPVPATTNTMALLITDLPCEIIATVFTRLDHIKSLLPCLLTCRRFYHAYKEYPRSGIKILGQQISPALLPYSAAVQEASRSPSLHPRLSTLELLESLHNNPGSLTNRLRDYPPMAMVRLTETHKLVEKYADSCASAAWNYPSEDAYYKPRQRFICDDDVLSLSSTERFRFCRAFYRFELYVRLFCGDDAQHIDLFFSGRSPWENEQLTCTYDYLAEILCEIFSRHIDCSGVIVKHCLTCSIIK
ncbi:hypothetical protein F4678DRAFT_138360 [Xylaria arbuscula]|nr:hypothetical protein F4678DRAFT_138360 [Xylaria arbuscula]